MKMEYAISKIEVLERCRLSLLFNNGSIRVVDLAPLIAKGGVFKRLADEQYFRQVRIMEHGFFLEWPDELDIGADSLWHRGKPAPKPTGKAPVRKR
jgi:hypothetical protein